MSKAVNNAFYYTIGSIIKALTSFLLLPIFANILGTAQYGVLSLLQTFSAILATLMTFATERSLYRLYYDYKDQGSQNKFLSTIFWSITLISAFIILAAIICGNYLSSFLGNIDSVKVLYLVIIYTFFMALINYSQIILQVEQDGKQFLLISILLLLTYNLLSLLFLYFYNKTYQSLVYANLAANAIVLPIAYYRIRKRIKLYYSFSILKSTLKYSMPMFLMIVFAWLLNMSDRLFLAHYSSLNDLGLYSMGSKIVSVMIMFDAAIFQAYGPYFYNIANTIEEVEAKNKLKQVNDAISFIICSFALLIVLFSNTFIRLVLKPEYYGCLIYIYFLVISSVFKQQSGLLNPMIYQNKKTKEISAITIFCALSSVLLNNLFMPRYGAIVAAISNLTVNLLMFSLTLILAKKNYYIKLNIPIVLVSVMLIILLYGIDNLFISSIWTALLCKAVLITVSVILLISLKIIEKDNIKYVTYKIFYPLIQKLR